jgi:hypothetical protein
MILCVDVNYRAGYALAAGIVFRGWHDEESVQEIVEKVTNILKKVDTLCRLN